MPFESFKAAAKSAIGFAKTIASSSKFITTMNFAKTFAKGSQYTYSSDAMQPFSGQALADLAGPFAESVGLGNNLPVTEAFNKYATSKTRISSVDKFSAAQFDGEPLAGKLTITKDTPTKIEDSINLVRSEINKALKLTKETNDARERYKDDVADLEMCIRRPDFNYLPSSLIDYMFSIRGQAVESIKAQHAKELENIDAIFEKDTYRDALQKSLGLDDEGIELDEAEQKKHEAALKEQLDTVKKSMVDELKASHAKEITAFEESINKPIKDALSTSKSRVAYLAMIDKVDQNKENINKLVAATSGDLSIRETTAAEAAAVKSGSKRYKGVDVKDLKTIMTATGRTVTAQGENTYTLALPNRILSPFYYRSSEHNLKRDIMMLPLTLRARGFDTIEMNINHPDPEYRKELCRIAMEACLEAGFEAKNIKIISGEDVYAEEKPGDIKKKLFADCGARYEASLVEAEKNKKDWEEALEESEVEESPQAFKENLAKTVATAKAEEAERKLLESGGDDLTQSGPPGIAVR